jgi:xanthine dehydrogenase small subunit
MRDFVQLYINGRRHEVRGDQAFWMLSDYLRYHARLPGTKVVCAEGDCGACAVLLGTPDPAATVLKYRAVTSCIALMGQVDGTHIVTVEGLAEMGANGGVHPAQASMAACNGAQCGYCTPGIVVTLAGMCETRKACGSSQPLSDAEVRFGLTGNLCRCTGYAQIFQAGTSVSVVDVRGLNEYFSSAPMIADLLHARQTEMRIESAGKTFYKPKTIASACAFKLREGTCAVLSGGTDLGVMLNKGRIDPPGFLSMGGLEGFSEIDVSDSELIVGGGATLAALEAATQKSLPALHDIMRRHGSPLIRNAGTLAGNIVNGSPIGDTMPALMVLNAEVELTGISGTRRVNMNDFYVGYRKTVMKPDELVTRVFIPRLRDGEILRLYKVSKRWDLDISTFAAALWVKMGQGTPLNGNGNRNGHASLVIEEARIAYGGVGPMIVRLAKTESLLKGQALSEELMTQAGAMAVREITPISDVRSSADYRFQLAENIPLKWYYDVVGEKMPGSNADDGQEN